MRKPSSSALTGDNSDMKPETTAEKKERPDSADTPGYKVTMQQGSARQQTTGRDVKHWPVSDANCPRQDKRHAAQEGPHFNEEN